MGEYVALHTRSYSLHVEAVHADCHLAGGQPAGRGCQSTSNGLHTDQLLKLLHGGGIAAQWRHLGQGPHNGGGCRDSTPAVGWVYRVVHMAAGREPDRIRLLQASCRMSTTLAAVEPQTSLLNSPTMSMICCRPSPSGGACLTAKSSRKPGGMGTGLPTTASSELFSPGIALGLATRIASTSCSAPRFCASAGCTEYGEACLDVCLCRCCMHESAMPSAAARQLAAEQRKKQDGHAAHTPIAPDGCRAHAQTCVSLKVMSAVGSFASAPQWAAQHGQTYVCQKATCRVCRFLVSSGGPAEGKHGSGNASTSCSAPDLHLEQLSTVYSKQPGTPFRLHASAGGTAVERSLSEKWLVLSAPARHCVATPDYDAAAKAHLWKHVHSQ